MKIGGTSQSEEIRNLWEMMTIIPKQISVVNGKSGVPVITKALEEQLNKLAKRDSLFLPNLQEHNETVAIFSDYGGEATTSGYYVFSFLICAFNGLVAFRDAQSHLREQHKLNTPAKEFSFKTLDYGPVDRALSGYIRNISNLVPGVLISVVVEKGPLCLWGEDKRNAQFKIVQILKDAGLGDWKPEPAEKLVTVIHLVSYLIALLAKDGQKIFWQSDDDAIMANEKKSAQAGKLFGEVLSFYTSAKFTTVGYAKSFGKESTLLLDLLSVPDLVAGSIDHYLTRRDDSAELKVKEGANRILVWHGYQGLALKKYAFIFRAGEKGQISSGTLDFEVIKPIPDMKFFDINLLKKNAGDTKAK